MRPSYRDPAQHRTQVIVGREREQHLLRRTLDDMLAGHGSLVLVSGEAGIGKTTLVEDLAARAQEVGCLVLWGRGYDLTTTPPYGLWIEIAHRYRATGLDSPFPASLDDSQMLANLGSQERLFAHLAAFFADAALYRPLILMLEDVHWADPASLALLRFLAREVHNKQLLLVATYRTDELGRQHPVAALIPQLVREAAALRLELRQLDDAAVRDLLMPRYHLADTHLERLVAYLREHAGGNPLFIDELLRTMQEDGLLTEQDGSWQLGDFGHLVVPALLVQVIDGRLGRLSEHSRRLLEVAAVIGQEVTIGIWQTVSGAGEGELVQALEDLVSAHVLMETVDPDRVRFVHALVCEAVYGRMVSLRRHVLHRQVAEAMIALSQLDPDAVAHHFRQAGDSRAVEWLIRAGDRARRAFVWSEASDRYTEALAVLADDSGATRAWLLQRLAGLYIDEDSHRAHELFGEAERVAKAAGDGALRSYASFMHGLVFCMLGEHRAGLAEMRTAVSTLSNLSVVLRSQLATSLLEVTSRVPEPAAQLVSWLVGTGHFEEARTLGEQVLAPGSATSSLVDPNRLDAGAALYGLAQLRATFGEPDRAREMYARARALFAAAGDLPHVHGILNQEMVWVVIPYEFDQPERRRRMLAEIERTKTTASGVRVARVVPGTLIVPLSFLDGDWVTARRAALTARARVSGGAGRAVPVRTLGPLARAQGDTALAWELIREDLRDGPETEPGSTIYPTSVVLLRVAADLALDEGNLQSAFAWLQAHDRWLDWAGAVLGRAEGRLLWARYHRESGDLCRARLHAEQSLTQSLKPRQPLALLAAHRLLGEIATEDNRYSDAEWHLQLSLTLADVCVVPFEHALTLLAVAELRTAESRTSEARALLLDIRETCESLGAGPTLARAAALEKRLAVTPARPERPSGLTVRELEVLRLVASGRSNREIADALSISVRTVERHITNLYAKIDARGKADATAFAFRHHLI